MSSATITVIISLITALLGPMAVEWFKTKLSNKPKDPVGEAIQLNEKIDIQLQTIIEELGCDRVWLAQFHNGGFFYPTGKSIQKFSIFYEKVADKILSIKETFQNIPVSLFPKLLSKVYNQGEVIIHKENNDNMDLFSLTGEYNSVSSYNIALNSLSDKFIGILSLSYDSKQYSLTEDEWEFLRDKATTIGVILSEYLDSKKN